jgi:DNA invertase Pin-like site-specific DNA recombinase
MELVGYARVSTFDQNLDLQKDALSKVGCIRVFEDYASGAKVERKGLIAALDYVRRGDTLVVWKLDRLGRSTKDLLKIVDDLKKKEVGFKSLKESIDTNTSGGKLTFHIFSSLAEFERDVIIERTNAGLVAARARGRQGGRPAKLSSEQVIQIKKLHKDRDTSISSILTTFNIRRPTLYKYLKMK